MRSFEPSDREQEIAACDDVIQFEDLDASNTWPAERWNRPLQRLFTRKLMRYWFIGGIVVSFVCLLLVLAPLFPFLHTSSTQAPSASFQSQGGSLRSYLEAVTPQFVYEEQSESGIIRALRRSDGTPVWSYQVSTMFNESLAGGDNSLIVVGNILYTYVYKGRDSALYALSASTGALLWIYNAPDPFAPVSPSITVANGIVYDVSIQGSVIALQAGTGKPLWSYQQSGREIYDVQFHLVENVIYLSLPQEKQTIALDALNGVSLWHVNQYLMFIAAISDISYFSDQQDTLYTFQSRTGSMLWMSSPSLLLKRYVIGSDDLFISAEADGSVEALHTRTGSVAWRSKPAGLSVTRLLLVNSRLYVVNSDTHHSILMSLNPSTGNLLWQYVGITFSQVERVGDHIYVNSIDGHFYALQAETGKQLWHSLVAIPVDKIDEGFGTASNSIFQGADNHIIIMTSGENSTILTILDDNDGHIVWQNFSMVGMPYLQSSTIYLSQTDGQIHAYAERTRRQVWVSN